MIDIEKLMKEPGQENRNVIHLIKQLEKLLEDNEFNKNRLAAHNAKSIVKILFPATYEVAEDRSACVLTYQMGPFEKSPSEEEKKVYELVLDSLQPIYDKQRSTEKKQLYRTIDYWTTITSETMYDFSPGVTSHVIELHRKKFNPADFPPVISDVYIPEDHRRANIPKK